MTTDAAFKKKIQQLAPGQLVQLFTLDLSPIGESTTYNFTNGTMDNGALVEFNSVVYTPLPVEVEGFEQTGEGKLPRPRIRISNVTGVLQSAVVTYNDLVGATLKRKRTFYEFLDGGSSPDDTAYYEDQFIVDRKTKQNKFEIEWELVSALDIENVLLPRKQALGTCTWRYRYYVDGAFVDINDDEGIECPYVGANYFTDSGAVTANADEDSCGRRLMDCKLRFPGDNAILPTSAFPNIRRFFRVNS